MNKLKLIITKDDKIRCPIHGKLTSNTSLDYEAQDPAPCGCAWVWEDGELIAVPSLQDNAPAVTNHTGASIMRFATLFAVALFLVACGRTPEPTPTPTATTPPPTQTPAPAQAPTHTPVPVATLPPASPPTPDATAIADIWETVPHVAVRNEQAQDAGGVVLAIGRVRIDDWAIALDRIPQLREIPATNDSTGATLFGSIAVTVTNNTGGKIHIYPAQGVIVVGNEQVSANSFLSDSVGGELFPGVVSTGNVRFWLKRTTYDQIAQGVEMLYEVAAPYAENYEDLSETPYTFRFQLAPE